MQKPIKDLLAQAVLTPEQQASLGIRADQKVEAVKVFYA